MPIQEILPVHTTDTDAMDRSALPSQIRKVIKPVGYVARKEVLVIEEDPEHPRIDTSEGYQPFGPPIGFEDTASTYLEVDLDPTRDFIKSRFNVGENSDVIIGFSGSNELLERIVMSLEDKTQVWGVGPHFPGFTQHIKVIDHSEYVPIAPPLNLSVGEALELMMNKKPEKLPSAIFICNPDARGGNAPREEIVKFIEHFTSQGVMIIIDEVNGDFLPDTESLADLTNNNSYLVVVRSYSKGFDFPEKGISMIISHKTYAQEYRNQMRDHHYRSDAKMDIEHFSNPAFILPPLDEIRQKTALHKNLLLDLFNKYEVPYLPTSIETPILFIDGGEDDFYDELKNYIHCVPGVGFFETYNSSDNSKEDVSELFFGKNKTPLTNRYVRIGLPLIDYGSLKWEEVVAVYDELARNIKGVMHVVKEFRSHKMTII